MITYQLVCILVALLVTGVLVRCEPEDSQADTSHVEDNKPETEEEEDLQPEQTGQLLNALFGKFDSLKGKSFFNFGKNGCYRDPCYPYYGGGGGGGGGGGVYYKYVPVPISYGGSVSSPASYYYYYQGNPAPAGTPPAPAPQPSYTPSYYYVVGIPVSRPSVKVVPQPTIPYRPVYPQPTIHCTTSPCAPVPYYGTGGLSGGGQLLAGSSFSSVESQPPAGGAQDIVGAASVPLLKGFTPSESFPEKPVEITGVATDEVKC